KQPSPRECLHLGIPHDVLVVCLELLLDLKCGRQAPQLDTEHLESPHTPDKRHVLSPPMGSTRLGQYEMPEAEKARLNERMCLRAKKGSEEKLCLIRSKLALTLLTRLVRHGSN
ncbi:unnamed protein product, partial [Lymnaea stagnalis]